MLKLRTIILISGMCAFGYTAAAQQQQQSRCLPLEMFSAMMTKERASIAVSMTDADGDRREIWAKADGQWVQVWYPTKGGGQAVCFDSGGTDFETHFPAKTGRGA